MKLKEKKIIRLYKQQDNRFNREIITSAIEKTFPPGATQKLHLGAGTHNLEIVIPFNVLLNTELLNASVLELIKSHGLLRSILIHKKGQILWQQHAPPGSLFIPTIDLSRYPLKIQQHMINKLAVAKSFKHFSTHSFLYRFIVGKNILLMYLKKYFRPGSRWYGLISATASLTKYLKSGCRKNALLYKMLIIKKNMKEYVFFMRLDHIIGDETSMDLIKQGILRCYQSGVQGGQASRDSTPSYDHYLEQLAKGPKGIDQTQLNTWLNIDDYQHYSTLFKNFMNQNRTPQVHTFQYDLAFDESRGLTQEKAWEISFILINILCQRVFNIPKIPSKLLYYGRNYAGHRYFNTVGEFWDLIPLLSGVDEEHPWKITAHANKIIQLVSSHNINFVTLFLNSALNEKYQRTVELIAPEKISPPEPTLLINFTGKFSPAEASSLQGSPSVISPKEKKQLKKEKYLSIRSQGGFLINSYYTSQSIFIKVESLVELDSHHLTRQLNHAAEKLVFPG